MADLLYSWANLEKDIVNGDVGYFHALRAPFNKLKTERSPDYIWLVRKSDRLWLLGKLKVTDRKPSNFPKNHKSQYIFYDLSKSHFFRDVVSVQATVADTLERAAGSMLHANFQGAKSVDVFDPVTQRQLERLTKGHDVIPFEDFSTIMRGGKLPSPPYESFSTVRNTKITTDDHSRTQGLPSQPAAPSERTILAQVVAPAEPPTNAIPQPTPPPQPSSEFGTSQSVQAALENDTTALSTAEREAVAKIRIGQGGFRDLLLSIVGERCWMSGIEGKRLLIASHIKPWSHCEYDTESRGQIDNGLLLSPLWDSAFDSGLISFDDEFNVVVSAELSASARDALKVADFSYLHPDFRTERRRKYLAYHLSNIFEYWRK